MVIPDVTVLSNRYHISISVGVVLPIGWPCYHDDKLLGVMGVDIHLGDVVDGITYFSHDKNAYAFLIDKTGERDLE